jgi:hypothetical protein
MTTKKQIKKWTLELFGLMQDSFEESIPKQVQWMENIK